MNELRFEALRHAELSHVTAAFGPGKHVVLGHESDGTNTLLMLAAGLLRPTSGRVALAGLAPWSNAQVRRRLAALCADERLLPGRDTASAVGLALRARADARSAGSVLDSAGLAALAKRRVSALTTRETRAVALAIALSHPAPALLALHEPLGLLGLVTEDFVVQTLTRLADAGSIVLCSASRLEDASRLGGTLSALERGFWLDATQAQPPLSQIALRVHTPEPRRLAARLSEAPDISAVEWAGGQELLVRGSQLERVAHSVVANARAEAIRITAMKQDPPALEQLAATRAGLARAFYERAQAKAAAGQA